MLFAQRFREGFSNVRDLRRSHNPAGRGRFSDRPSVYSPFSSSSYAVVYSFASSTALLQNDLLTAAKEKREKSWKQGTVEAGFEPAGTGYEPAVEPQLFRKDICCRCLLQLLCASAANDPRRSPELDRACTDSHTGKAHGKAQELARGVA